MYPQTKATLGKILTACGLSFVAAAQGCSLNNQTRHYRLTDDAILKEQKLLAVYVVSDSLFDIRPFKDPAHNFVVFSLSEDDGIALHGLAVCRTTNELTEIGDNDDALYAAVNSDEYFYSTEDPRAITEVFCGSREDVLRKILIALDAMACINEQNLVYDKFELFGRGQNSNSVAYTLIRAMNLEFPDENTAEWVPGHGRFLLPENWRSYYEDWQPPVEGTAFLEWYIEEMREILNDRHIEIRSQGAPDRARCPASMGKETG